MNAQRELQELKACPENQFLAGRGELILVVDDEEPIRRLAHAILTRHGYEILTAENGVEGVVAFAQHQDKIKAVITEMLLPKMNGLALARALRRMDPALPIIATSGLGAGTSDEFKREELAALGVRTFLSKPFAAEGLLLALDKLLRDPLEAGIGTQA